MHLLQAVPLPDIYYADLFEHARYLEQGVSGFDFIGLVCFYLADLFIRILQGSTPGIVHAVSNNQSLTGYEIYNGL